MTRSNIDLLQRRCKAGFTASGSVDKVEKILEESASTCDDIIDFLIDLHMDILARCVTCDLPDEIFSLFEGTGTGESISSIILFLQKQKTITVFFLMTVDECHGASWGNKRK
jgi:hypothetical protein